MGEEREVRRRERSLNSTSVEGVGGEGSDASSAREVA